MSGHHYYAENHKLIGNNTHLASNSSTTNGQGNGNNEVNSGDVDMNEDEYAPDNSEADDIIDEIKDETAPIDALIHAHTGNEFTSVEEELSQIEDARKAVDNISKKLDDIEKVLKEK